MAERAPGLLETPQAGESLHFLSGCQAERVCLISQCTTRGLLLLSGLAMTKLRVGTWLSLGLNSLEFPWHLLAP